MTQNALAESSPPAPVEPLVVAIGRDTLRDDQRRARLGGKATSLGDMARLGLRVPPGFTLAADAAAHLGGSADVSAALRRGVESELSSLERETGRRFGGTHNPLLLSVRSGAPVSMPGMLETLLNVGSNEQTMLAVARRSGDEQFALRCYGRFLSGYAETILGVGADEVAAATRLALESAELTLLEDRLRRLRLAAEAICGQPFELDPMAQLWLAVRRVFASWHGERARAYRSRFKLDESAGTACTVQAIVFGNLNAESGAGVVFTRDPLTGAARPCGEWLRQAQGDEVVNGTRRPAPLDDTDDSEPEALARIVPTAHAELLRGCRELEVFYRDMQDVEFTIEDGRLYFLQSRRGKRSPEAAQRIALELLNEGLISRDEALQRVAPERQAQFRAEIERGAIARQPESPELASVTLEIERKFRLPALPARELFTSSALIEQGYLLNAAGVDLRVRRSAGKCTITAKGSGGAIRPEWETELPSWCFELLWPSTATRQITKTRHRLRVAEHELLVDEFHGALEGLTLMECEFSSRETLWQFVLPAWAGAAQEVTFDSRYQNHCLAEHGLPDS